jgi:hypothetical protein
MTEAIIVAIITGGVDVREGAGSEREGIGGDESAAG